MPARGLRADTPTNGFCSGRPKEWQIPTMITESKTIGGEKGDLELKFKVADNVSVGLNRI